MKKLVSFFLVSSMICGLATGCGNTQASSIKQASTESVDLSSQSASDSTQPVTITLDFYTSSDVNNAQETIQRFEEQNPNITINTVVAGVDGGDQLMAKIASGTAPNVNILPMPQIDKYIYANALEDLTSYYNNWTDKDNINKEMLDRFKVNDKYYGIPYQEYSMVLFYNKSLFDEAGVTPPKTWDEIITVGKKLTIPEKQQYGFALNWTQWAEWWFEMFAWGAGGDLTEKLPDGQLKLTFTDPSVVTSAEFYREMKAANIIQNDNSLLANDLQNEFVSGRAAMYLDGSDKVSQYIQAGMDPDDIGISIMPIGPSGKGPMQIGGNIAIIPKGGTKEQIDASWKYIEFYLSKDEVSTEIKNMVEGGAIVLQNYSRTDVDVSQFTEISPEYKEVMDYATLNGQREFYGKGQVGSFANDAIQEIMVHEDADIIETFQKYQDQAMEKMVPDFNAAVLENSK